MATATPDIDDPRYAASTRPAPQRHDEYHPDPDRWRALAVVLAAGFMTRLDVSIVNVALPSIERGLHAQPNELEWIVAASALAPAAVVLVSMRLAQGFAGGLISPQISGPIQSLFRDAERGKAFGLFGSTIAISTAIGPLIGGALIALFGVHDGWRPVFFVNPPIGAAILLLARRYLPAPTAAERRPEALDPLGVILLGAAVVSILVPFIEQRTWDSPLRSTLFPLGALLLIVWVLHERRYGRTREPLVSLDLFRIRSYTLGAPVGLVYFAGFVAMFFILTQYLQIGLNYPAWKSGLAATPFAIGGALVASAGSRQVLGRGPKLVAFGLATFLVGMAGVWLAVGAHPGHDVALWTALPLLIAGLGGGLVISPNLTLTLSQVPVERGGSAGGLLQTGQRIGSAAGIAITGSIFYNQLASSHGDFASAFRHGIISIAAFVVVALVEPSGSVAGYVKEAGGARRSDGRAPDQPLRDRVERRGAR